MKPPLPIEDILKLDGVEFVIAFSDYLLAKKISGQPMTASEEEAYLLLRMMPAVETDGFDSIFLQVYSLRECEIVEAGLRKLNLNKLANSFAAAKHLYIDGKTDITEEEYQLIGTVEANDERIDKVEDIGQVLLRDPDGGIYSIEEAVRNYVKANPDKFV